MGACSGRWGRVVGRCMWRDGVWCRAGFWGEEDVLSHGSRVRRKYVVVVCLKAGFVLPCRGRRYGRMSCVQFHVANIHGFTKAKQTELLGHGRRNRRSACADETGDGQSDSGSRIPCAGFSKLHRPHPNCHDFCSCEAGSGVVSTPSMGPLSFAFANPPLSVVVGVPSRSFG